MPPSPQNNPPHMYWHFTTHIAQLKATHHYLLTELARLHDLLADLTQILDYCPASPVYC